MHVQDHTQRQLREQDGVKYGYTTRVVPLSAMHRIVPMERQPEVGDLVVAEVLSVGRNKSLETRGGQSLHLFPGDTIVGAFGHRYATDHFEGYVPKTIVDTADLLSGGGVIGQLASQNALVGTPTRLRVLGTVVDADGASVNQRRYGVAPATEVGSGAVIVVVGSAMNSGKTTTVGHIAHALSRYGLRVAAAKVTGTASGKDARFYLSAGARPVCDFVDAGYPSTFMLGIDELLSVYTRLVANLRATQPDVVVVEIADGIFQRETRMMLESPAFRSSIDHMFFAAGDSLSIESGVRFLRALNLPLRATSGLITTSPLASREAEAETSVPCLGLDDMLSGKLLDVLGMRLMTAASMIDGMDHEPAAWIA